MAALMAIVEAVCPGAKVWEVQALTGGVSAEVTAVTVTRRDGSQERLVVRHRATPATWGERRSIAEEYALMLHLHDAGVPVPRPRLLWSAQTLVMDFVAGTPTLPATGAEQMATVLAQIHRHRPGVALPVREDPLPTLQAALTASEWAALLDLAATPASGPCLLHGDFWPGNLVWQADKLVAVLDWEDAASGDPLSDVACTRVELQVAADPTTASAFTAHYLAATGIDPTRLLLWDLYVATTALATMDQWGLPPPVLAHRQATTQQFRDQAARRLAAGRFTL